MLRSACFLLLVLLMTMAKAAEESVAESAMEKPAVSRRSTEGTAKVMESRGVHTSWSQQQAVEVARQGPLHANNRQNFIAATFNALNPMPYIRGGLDGMREVANQRFYPFQGMFNNQGPRYNKARPLGPTPLNKGAGKHVRGTGNRPVGGGGSGGNRGVLHGIGGGGGGGVGQRGTRGTNSAHPPSFSTDHSFKGPSHFSDSGSTGNAHFGTPKPQSVMTGGEHDPHSGSSSFGSLRSGGPDVYSSVATGPPDSEGKFTKVINIHIPEEMQNLTVLEISMKTNGDISISGGPEHGDPSSLEFSDDGNTRHVSPYQTSTFPASIQDMLLEDQRLHGPNPASKSISPEPGFPTNDKGLTINESDLYSLLSDSPYGVTSIQDIIRMQMLGKTNSETALPWHALDSLHPHRIADPRYNYRTAKLLQTLLLRNSRAPNLSPELRSYIQRLKDQSYYLPVISTLLAQNQARAKTVSDASLKEQSSQQDDESTPVYYIDITLPGNPGDNPSVRTSHLRRHRRSLEFDGWFPMDVSNPMADDPTLGYQPPPLERVRFRNEPVSEKPLYPVIPENPPVFVVRAEPQQPKYHSVYGTENIEYFHIHPQTNTVRAFRAPSQSVGAIQFVAAPQLTDDSTSQPVEDNIDAPPAGLDTDSNFANIPTKEPGFDDRIDTIDEEVSEKTPSTMDEEGNLHTKCESDLDGAHSEIQSSVVKRPVQGRPLRQRTNINNQDTISHTLRFRPDPPGRRYDLPWRDQDPAPTRPALHELLGNLPQESQIEESPYLGSATDSARTSFFREIPPPNFRYSTRQTSGPRTPFPTGSRTRTRVDVDRKASQSSHRPWFLIDTRSSGKGREPSIASYIFPEAEDEKIHYKPFGPVSYISKGDKTSQELLQNPHLDDHMNSYKPTITANSLSELLQIFRFTQVTEESDSATEEPVTLREFRYTRPTEDPPTTGSSDEIFPSSFRYTPSPSKFIDPTTEIPTTEKQDQQPAEPSFIDAVADTNSLDGYLFSDSEASPEYAHPQVRPNVVPIDHKKDEALPKSINKESFVVKHGTNVNSKNVRGGIVTPGRLDGLEIIYPGQPQEKRDSTTSPSYIIYQGHSKVQVYGINSAEEKRLGNVGYSNVYFLSNSERPITSSLSTSGLLSSPPRGTSFPSTTSTSTLTTTSSSSPTTVSTSTTVTPITSAPNTLPLTSTPSPVTNVTTVAPPTNITTQDIPLTPREDGEYDYFYDGRLGFPDLAFGEDYLGERHDLPLISVPSPFLPESSLPHLTIPPTAPETRPPVTPPTTEDVINSLPRTDSPLHDAESILALSPAVALTRAELSGARPVFFTKRRPDSIHAEDDAQLSQPFEYLSQLRNIETEKPTKVKDVTPKPLPQPRMKRVTESVKGA
ncbi:hypothetical protein Pcinc_025514 [Petrolisthes cinctipes]|uniref:Mucin-5AC n=1 Tax=Petrolisthes cinctipes TaxID=88211 RepID=A0AAE1F7P5_PETCI|nr:hypothetical protein Pcinc_025514 [Petrolisthes cinctipes]